MNNLSDLINKNIEYTKELQEVQKNLNENLKELNSFLNPIFEKYTDCFTSLRYKAEREGISFPEIYYEGFGRWGNRGLIRISYEVEGFATLHTKDYFRNETDYFEAYLPKKYLENNALEMIENDAKRISVEIEAIILAQDLEQTNNLSNSKKIKL
jgi:hypothetical protein